MTRAATQDEINDHRRDERKHEPRPSDQRYAVAGLVGYCEGIVGWGLLGADAELRLRRHIAATLVAFDMPSKVDLVRGPV